MTATHSEIGRWIVEHEPGSVNRAGSGATSRGNYWQWAPRRCEDAVARTGVIGWCGSRHRPRRAGPRVINLSLRSGGARACGPTLTSWRLPLSPTSLRGTTNSAGDTPCGSTSPRARHRRPTCFVPLAQSGPATKLPGPGRPFGFELPGGLTDSELTFVIQNRTTVETHFAVPFRGAQAASTFAILALDATRIRGEQPPTPPYPRPQFHTLDELAAILAEVYSLGCLLVTVGSGSHA